MKKGALAVFALAYAFVGQQLIQHGDTVLRVMGGLMVFAGGLILGILIAHPAQVGRHPEGGDAKG